MSRRHHRTTLDRRRPVAEGAGHHCHRSRLAAVAERAGGPLILWSLFNLVGLGLLVRCPAFTVPLTITRPTPRAPRQPPTIMTTMAEAPRPRMRPLGRSAHNERMATMTTTRSRSRRQRTRNVAIAAVSSSSPLDATTADESSSSESPADRSTDPPSTSSSRDTKRGPVMRLRSVLRRATGFSLTRLLPPSLPIRKLQAECGCKSIKFHLQETPDTYRAIEQPSVYCHCSDCVGFPTQCRESAQKHGGKKCDKCVDVVDHTVEAPNHVFFYNANVQVVEGQDLIGWHKRGADTSTLRFYAKCCGTALGFKFLPMNTQAFYGALLKEQEGAEYGKEAVFEFPDPYYAFHAGAQPEGKEKHGECVRVYDKKIAFFPVISRFVGRNALGSILGKNKGTFVPPADDKEYGVGTTGVALVP